MTNSADGRKYWNKLKQHLKKEGNETVTNCHQLKMKVSTGKDIRKGLTDEWKRAGIKEGLAYAKLTNGLTRAWSGKTVQEYKQLGRSVISPLNAEEPQLLDDKKDNQE